MSQLVRLCPQQQPSSWRLFHLPSQPLSRGKQSFSNKHHLPGLAESPGISSHKAKTPIIAGCICGGVLFIAYIVGFIVYLTKRRRRRELRAKIAAGAVPPPTPPDGQTDCVIIPPDPAIVLGIRQPGERISLSGQTSNGSPPPKLPGTQQPRVSKTISFVSNPPVSVSVIE
jgi:hypothetical protein